MKNAIWIGLAAGVVAGAFVTAGSKKVCDSVCACKNTVKSKIEHALNDGQSSDI